MGFVYLGAHYTQMLPGVHPDMILTTIAAHNLGQYAAWVIAIAVLLVAYKNYIL